MAVESAQIELNACCFRIKSSLDEKKIKAKIKESDRNSVLEKCNETVKWLDTEQSTNKEVYILRQNEMEYFCNKIILPLSLDFD